MTSIHRLPTWGWLIALCATLVACAGGGSGGPALGQLEDLMTTSGEPVTVPLVIVSEDAATLTVSTISSNEQVLSASGIQVTGGGVNRSLVLSPSHTQTGTTSVNVVVKDSRGQAYREFDLEVLVPFSGGHEQLSTQADDPLGFSVDIEDGTIATAGIEAVWVFELTGDEWVELSKVTPAPNGVSDVKDFGRSVALGGGHLIVGAPDSTTSQTEQGVAYLFERVGDAYPEDWHFIDNDPEAGEALGYSVGLVGGNVLVGVPFGSSNDLNSGVVNVYQPDQFGYGLLGKLTPADAATTTGFGRVLDVTEDLLVIGNYADDDRGTQAGAAYVFVSDAGFWTEDEKLVPVELEANDQFGHDVAVDQGWVLVSAWDDDDQGEDAGAVYVFHDDGSGWQQDVIYSPDAAPQGSFGSAVELDYPYAVVGAYLDDSVAHNAGAVYVLRHDGETWHHVAKLTSPLPAAEAGFGWDVAIDGDHLVVAQAQPGLVFVYERMPLQQ